MGISGVVSIGLSQFPLYQRGANRDGLLLERFAFLPRNEKEINKDTGDDQEHEHQLRSFGLQQHQQAGAWNQEPTCADKPQRLATAGARAGNRKTQTELSAYLTSTRIVTMKRNRVAPRVTTHFVKINT